MDYEQNKSPGLEICFFKKIFLKTLTNKATPLAFFSFRKENGRIAKPRAFVLPKTTRRTTVLAGNTFCKDTVFTKGLDGSIVVGDLGNIFEVMKIAGLMRHTPPKNMHI